MLTSERHELGILLGLRGRVVIFQESELDTVKLYWYECNVYDLPMVMGAWMRSYVCSGLIIMWKSHWTNCITCYISKK